METDVGDGPRGIQTDWSDMMATSIEEDINFDKVIHHRTSLGKETNTDEPVIFPCPNNPPSPFPPDNMPIPSSDSSVAEISHDPTSILPMLKSLYESLGIRSLECASRHQTSNAWKVVLP
jgi:hypothetical protein